MSREFVLDTNAVVPGSATALEIGAETAADVLSAIAQDVPFPKRRIDLANTSLAAKAGKDIRFGGGQRHVVIHGSGGVRLAVLDRGADVISMLAVPDAAAVGLELKDRAGVRYAMLLAGYEVEGGVSGSHPIGVIGAATFGVEARRERTLAVIRRFTDDAGAAAVLRDTVKSFRTPRHVRSLDDIAAGAMLITEVDGSIALSISARLGYDFGFVRQAKMLGLTGDVGLKLETGLSVALGLNVSGRYLVALDRESLDTDATTMRLRLFKLSKKGWDFGLNLCAAAQGVAEILPEKVDDLVRAVFGVQGQQVLKDLQGIEAWTGPDTDLSEKVAGLTTSTALDLLKETTGIDPHSAFREAKGKLTAALKVWDALPDKVSGVLWSILTDAGLTAIQTQELKNTLGLLASTDAATRTDCLIALLTRVDFASSPVGKLVTAGAEKGVLELLEDTDAVQPIAANILDVLDGGVIKKLQTFVEDRLNLEKIRVAVTKGDFDQVDQWLRNRLSTFLDDKLEFERLDEIKAAIDAALKKRQEIYVKARQALTKAYDFKLAAKYQKSTERTALVDATFDLAQPEASALLATVLGDGGLDSLLTTTAHGLTLGRATLTHEISQGVAVEVNFPFFHSAEDKINRSLAKVNAVEETGRVLLYELDSTDLVTVRNRTKSQLAVAAAVPFRMTGVRVHSVSSATWAYEYRVAKENMRRQELEHILAPFVERYLPNHFGGNRASLSSWVTDLDRRVEDEVKNGSDEFGDVLLGMEVSLPATAITAWFQRRDVEDLRADAMNLSRRLQSSLKELLPFYYFRDLDNVRQDLPASALLVYAAIPPSTNIRLRGGSVDMNLDRTNKNERGVHWDWRDPAKRNAMIRHPETLRRLSMLIAQQHARLKAADRSADARFFEAAELGDFISSSRFGDLEGHLGGLLRLEDVIVRGAADALHEMQRFHHDASTAPSKAIERLADFGAEITKTFNERLSSTYGGGDLLRPLGSMIFLEGSRTLNPTLNNVSPNAILSLTVLRERRTFRMSDFLSNQLPSATDIAVAQRLVAAT